MMKGNGSPRPPSPPRGSPTGGSSPGGEGAPSSDHNNGPVPRLNVGQNGKHAPSSAPSPSPSKSGGKGEGNNGDGDGDESSSERIESLTEELEDARGDLQLTISDLRVILEATPAFVCAVDPHGHVSGWNTAAIEITGLRRDAVLQRHFVEHFVPQQYQQPAADAMEAAFSLPADDPLAGEPGEPFDLTLWRGGVGETSKQTVKIRVRAYARRLAGGQPVGLLLIQDDAASNDSMRERTNVEREVQDLQGVISLREQVCDAAAASAAAHAAASAAHTQQRQQRRTRSGGQHLAVLASHAPFTLNPLHTQELEEHEAELASLRQELQTFYEKTAAENGRTITKQVSKGPINVLKTSSGPGLIPGSGQRVAWGAQNKVTGFTKGSSPREFGNKMRHDQMRNEALGTPPPPNPTNPPTR